MKLKLGQEETLKVYANKYYTKSGIVARLGEVYNFSARGIWVDFFIPTGPNGFRSRFMDWLSGGKKRMKNQNWLALMGCLTTNEKPFLIGESLTEKEFQENGELQFFPNDADGKFYRLNNLFSIELTIKRIK